MGAQLGGAPADVPDVFQRRVVAVEAGAHDERIGREDCAQVFERKRRGVGFDVELHVAEGAPPERAKQPVRAAVGDEAVFDAAHGFAFDVVAIAFLPAFPEGFAVSNRNYRIAPATGDKLRVSRRQRALIEQERGARVGRDGERRAALQKIVAGRDARCASDVRQPLRFFFHQRNRARHQEPARRAVLQAARRADGYRDGWLPGGIIVIERLPTPRML